MNYTEALDYIHGLQKFGIKLGFERINFLLEALGNPHEKLKAVHIAGTNGKGSTSAMITSILKESGFKVGQFTSPYLERFTERIQIYDDNLEQNDIPEKEVIEFVKNTKPILEKMKKAGIGEPTEFEFVTAMCFSYFEKCKVDIAVVEVGMGGRLDSTNVIKPLVSVITPISLDHTGILGDNLKDISREKAGIIKPESSVICGRQPQEALGIIKNKCLEANSPFYIYGKDFCAVEKEFDENGQVFDIYGINDNYHDVYIPLLGKHQQQNAANAVASIELLNLKGLQIDKASIYEGLKKVKWPGRMEILAKSPTVLIDGAHNPAGAEVLAETIKTFFKYKKLVLVIGVLADKDFTEIVSILGPLADKVVITKPESPRALEPERLRKEFEKFDCSVAVEPNIVKAVETGLSMAGQNDMVCFTGSLYLIGKVRSIIL